MNDYDVIVIGAGNAGLTAAATLQRGGARTLLVERHNVPGGCGTSFVRGRFEFETALHQLSGVGREGQPNSLRALFAELGVADRLEFIEERDLYRAVVPGALDVTLPADWTGAAEALDEAFPGNLDRLKRFFGLCREVAMWQVMAQRSSGERARRAVTRGGEALLRQGLRPVTAVLDEYFDDERVKTALGAYWYYLGQPPSRLPFQELATLLYTYVEFKPYHVRGGSQAMSTAVLDAFLAAGGHVRFHTSVERIMTRDGAVRGVRLAGGEELTTREVVSNASSVATYTRLLDRSAVPDTVVRDLSSRRIGVSAFVLHMGLDATPAELGFGTSTHFVNATLDEAEVIDGLRSLRPAPSICASAYDVHPIGFAPAGASHVSLMTLQYADPWEKVAPAEYARTKYAYAETLIDLLEKVTPGLRDAIEEVDVATPLTVMRYLGHPGGAIYGFDQDATESWLFRDDDSTTPVPGLHLAGAWAGVGGFQPTLEAGARVARNLLRRNAA
ncbi:phytoene desaturase family protein [Kitasatospora sp. NPDC101183]|uniref:phytoene desaturase family protein n=1 Tax=Kitasatospora sp. NPDC101183 TaxID=3364100 RepID=UPI00381F3484